MLDLILHTKWYIEDSIPARVYPYHGLKVWLSDIKRIYPHAPVEIYAVQFPNGSIIDGDVSTINKVLFDYFTKLH